jgi:hypothetical protein
MAHRHGFEFWMVTTILVVLLAALLVLFGRVIGLL